MTHCETCDRPVADDDQWRDVPDGERYDLCWGGSQCESNRVDWRARAMRAEETVTELTEPRILEMHLAAGKFDARIEGRGVAQIMAHAYWNLLTESKADNYVELRFGRGDKELAVTIQKVSGKSPATLRDEAIRDLAAARREAEELRAKLAESEAKERATFDQGLRDCIIVSEDLHRAIDRERAARERLEASAAESRAEVMDLRRLFAAEIERRERLEAMLRDALFVMCNPAVVFDDRVAYAKRAREALGETTSRE
jgi:hypothetical protein